MKRGSALLIVLGMLAFMVISAVAFSAFMRFSRMPSSYLRRTSSSRHLVKAALAEAIDIVDAAIANNPHPGVGDGAIKYPRNTGVAHNRNYWRSHIFTGTNQLVAAEDTVSTLTLEGLAYLPPALINEARYYSRHSTAAMWHSFSFDSGRYAFCAVDVSDHFNINKIPADIGRGSSPENRFSLAYVFENDGHTSYTIQPSSWDTFMEHYVSFANVKDNIKTPAEKGSGGSGQSGGKDSSGGGGGSKLPLVSLADLNLAVNKDGGDFRSYFPFVSYLVGGADDFISTPTGPIAEMQRHMSFVTDGYFPSSGGTGADDDYDLSDDKYQPFTGDDLSENNAKVIRNIIDKSTLGATRLRDYISRLGLVHLWDYLDEDNVPVSLAIPSVERIPMVCGIKATMNGSAVKVNIKAETPSGDGLPSDEAGIKSKITEDSYSGASKQGKPSGLDDKRTAKYVKKYVLDKQKFIAGIHGGSIKAIVAYPFRRGMDLKDPDSFTIDGHVEFFFTTGDFKFRTGNQTDVLHLENDAAVGDKQYKGNGVFHIPLNSQSCTFNNVTDEDSALQEFDFMMGPGSTSIGNTIDETPIFTVTYSQDEDVEPYMNGEKEEYRWVCKVEPTIESVTCGLQPIGADGNVDPDFANQNFLKNGSSKSATLRMAVWLRIKNGDGKTVDLVPACLMDDKNFNNINNFQAMGGPGNQMCGQHYPLMRFTCGSAFDFGVKAFDEMTGEIAVDAAPSGLVCGDPRWNWAPEHWFVDDNVSKQQWKDNNGKGVDNRDRDIFMATSDAGYLQSIYELALLPRLAGDFRPNNELYGNMEAPDDGRNSWATSFGGARNSDFMWRTYRPFKVGNAVRDDFESIGFVNDGGGTKLNPYSDSENVLMAAFANTPQDWWAASANTETGLSTGERKAADFNQKYAFSKMNSKAKFDWEDLERVASRFKSAMQTQTTINGWEDAYDDLWLNDGIDENKLMGAELQGDTDDLFGVDRKFLYGYWRDCFAVKQQLFLIFVRAEPMMMGGGAIGQTPPQLGARAVALVWRNPHRGSKAYTVESSGGGAASGKGTASGGSTDANAPHQTRVLMYRQFD